MGVRTDDAIEALVSAVREELVQRQHAGQLDLHDTPLPTSLSTRVVDFIDTEVRGPTVAERIGPVFTTERLAVLLAPQERRPLTTEAIRKRAASNRLVAFRSDDGRWLFPDWQFDRAHGRLQLAPSVIELWRALPHSTWMAPIDLAMWMNMSLHSLDGAPQQHVRAHGFDDVLGHAVQRLRARVEGSAA